MSRLPLYVRNLIALAAAVATLVCVTIAFFTGVINGVMVLGLGFAVVFAWAAGSFSRGFWVSDDPEYGEIDVELDVADAFEQMLRKG